MKTAIGSQLLALSKYKIEQTKQFDCNKFCADCLLLTAEAF